MLPKPYYEEPGIVIYRADAREIVPHLEPVDMIFTDPPYGHNNNDGDLIHNREAALGLSPSCESSPRPIQNDSPQEASDLAQWLFKESSHILASGG